MKPLDFILNLRSLKPVPKYMPLKCKAVVSQPGQDVQEPQIFFLLGHPADG